MASTSAQPQRRAACNFRLARARARLSWLTMLLAVTASVVATSGCTTMGARRAALIRDIRQQAAEVPSFANDQAFVRVLAALASVPRERFVPAGSRRLAYAESPQAIGYGQTISDPYIVAIMIAAAEVPGRMRVLEIGTGSGYGAAVLSRLADEVYSIEIVEPLAREAANRLRGLGYDNVHVRSGDGFAGWSEAAPFDAILVTAGAAEAPPTLLEQLAPGGRMVMPIGPTTVQERLMVFYKSRGGIISRCILGSAMFVPLTGKGGRSPRSMGIQEGHLPYCYGADLGRWDFQVMRR